MAKGAQKFVKVSPTHHINERGASWITIKKRRSGWYVYSKKRQTYGPYATESVAKNIAKALG